jgi:hypothetical protein
MIESEPTLAELRDEIVGAREALLVVLRGEHDWRCKSCQGPLPLPVEGQWLRLSELWDQADPNGHWSGAVHMIAQNELLNDGTLEVASDWRVRLAPASR